MTTIRLSLDCSYKDVRNKETYIHTLFLIPNIMNSYGIKEFSSLDKDAQDLIYSAIEAREFSYSPYSKFKVGAAIRLANGSIVKGCNVENAAYSPSVCAERNALCKAVSNGFIEFKAVAVVAFQEDAFTTPCGVCRQFLSEFVKEDDIIIYVCKPEPTQVLVTSIKTLLPMSFVPLETK